MCEVKGPKFYRCTCPSADPVYRAAQARARYAAKGAAAATAVIERPVEPVADAAPGPRAIDELRKLAADIDRHYSAGDPDATSLLTAAFGKPLNAIRVLGAALTLRAEELAGVTGAEANADKAERHKEAVAAFEVARAALSKEAEASHNRFDQMMTEEGVENWRSTDGPGSPRQRFRDYQDAHLAELREANERASAAIISINGEDRANLTKLADGYAAALAEIRPTGGSLATHELSDVKAVELAGVAAQIYPAAWLEIARPTPLGAVMTKARAHFNHEGVTSENVIDPPLRLFGVEKPEDTVNRVYTLVTSGVGRNGPDPSSNLYSRQWMQVSGTKKRPAGDGWELIEEDGVYFEEGIKRRVKAGSAWRRPARGKLPGVGMRIDLAKQGVADRPPGYATATHELGHFFQHVVPGISEMEQDWLLERTTTDGVRDRIREIRPRSKEYAWPDNFINTYIGKRYTDGRGNVRKTTEILTVGVQAMFGGDLGGLVGAGEADGERRGDDDMRAVILGIMASAAMSGTAV